MGKSHLQPLPRFLRRTLRRAVRWATRPHLELVFHPRYNLAVADIPHDPLRGERVLAFLASEGLVLRCSVHKPEPVWMKAVAKVHGAEYLESLRDPRSMTSIFGAEIDPKQADRLLDLQRLMTGGTLMATRRARQHGVGVNLGGGFHHARADQGAGFCIFNDVAVAIADERRRGFAGPVLVVDLDLHDGDGTREIFASDPSVHTFSIHARDWGPTEAVASTSLELGSEVEDTTYLEALEEHLPPLFAELRPRLVFYLAGCDPAHDDRMGDWKISPQAMLARDVRVAALARTGVHRCPLVILTAGGYSQESWRYTARFLSDLKGRGRVIEPPSTGEITFKRYRYIEGLLDPGELTGASAGNTFGLTEEDLFLPGWGPMKESRFLGYYSPHGIELLLERGGFLDRLRDLGFSHPTLDLQLDDPGGQTLRIFGHPDRKELLVELRLRIDRRSIPDLELLSVEWLLLQNPRARFGHPRRRLPGQGHPGLGMLGDVAAILRLACERLHLDGLVFVPSTYHVAVYGKGPMIFLDRAAEARFRALLELFRDTPIAEASSAVADGRVVDIETGEVVRWRPEPMVMPVAEKLEKLVAASRAAPATPSPRLRLSHR